MHVLEVPDVVDDAKQLKILPLIMDGVKMKTSKVLVVKIITFILYIYVVMRKWRIKILKQ